MNDPAVQVSKRKKSVTEMIERWEEIPVKLDRVIINVIFQYEILTLSSLIADFC